MVINVKMAEESVDSPAKSLNLMEKLKFLENDRIKTFQHWKHNDSQNCSIKKMAQAGFFYSGLNSDDDSATCFVCGKDLVSEICISNVDMKINFLLKISQSILLGWLGANGRSIHRT